MRHASAVLGVLAAASAASCGAGTARAEPDVWGAGKSLEFAIGSIGRLKAASELCGYHGRDRWDAMVTAIDERYERCVVADSRWSRLEDKAARKACEAKGPDARCGLGSLNVQFEADKVTRRARLAGVQAFCDGFPWKWVLEPGPDNEKAKADYVKAHPQGEITIFLRVFDWLKTLGRNPDWVKAPCHTSFW